MPLLHWVHEESGADYIGPEGIINGMITVFQKIIKFSRD